MVGMHALVATDTEVTATEVTAVLRMRGWLTVEVHGREAARRLQIEDYPLIITDIFMEDVDGIEIIDLAKTLTPETFVIAIENSVVGKADFVRIALLIGADAALTSSEVESRLFELLPDAERE